MTKDGQPTRDPGGRQISAMLTPAEAELLARHEKRLGGVKAALIAGLQALDQRGRITTRELIHEIELRLK